MAEYRVFELTSPRPFDGTTDVPATGWSSTEQASSQRSKRMTLTSLDPVGRFRPNALGRTRKLFALAVVWCNGPIGETDHVEVRSSKETADGTPANVLRTTHPLTISPMTAEAIILGDTDDLCVFFQGTENTGGTVHVEIFDLDREELFRWQKDHSPTLPPPPGDACCAVQTVEVGDADLVGSTVPLLPAAGRTLIIASFTDPGNDVALPDPASLSEGAEYIVRRQDGGWFGVTAQGGAAINGLAPGRVHMEGHEAWQFTLAYGPGGQRTWSATNRLQDWEITAINAPATLPSYRGWKVFDVNLSAGDPGPLVLPATSEIAPGQMHLLTKRGGREVTVQLNDPGEEFLDGVLGGQAYLLNDGDDILFIRDQGVGWRTVHNLFGETRAMLLDAANVVIAAGQRGARPVILTGGPGQTCKLPPINGGATPLGCEFWIMGETNAPTINVANNANERIVGLAASGTSVVLSSTLRWCVVKFVGQNGAGQYVWARTV